MPNWKKNAAIAQMCADDGVKCDGNNFLCLISVFILLQCCASWEHWRWEIDYGSQRRYRSRERKKNMKLCNFPKNPIQIEILESMGSVVLLIFHFNFFDLLRTKSKTYALHQINDAWNRRRQPTRECNIYSIYFFLFFLRFNILRRRRRSWASIEYELRFIRLLNPINLSTYLIWRLKTIKIFYVIHVAMRRNHDIINNKLHLNLFVANGNKETEWH